MTPFTTTKELSIVYIKAITETTLNGINRMINHAITSEDPKEFAINVLNAMDLIEYERCRINEIAYTANITPKEIDNYIALLDVCMKELNTIRETFGF